VLNTKYDRVGKSDTNQDKAVLSTKGEHKNKQNRCDVKPTPSDIEEGTLGTGQTQGVALAQTTGILDKAVLTRLHAVVARRFHRAL
jgi:hypothetical protein